MKKTTSALVLAGSLTFFGAGAANAVESYPAPPTCASVSDSTVVPGSTITFFASTTTDEFCFTPGEAIRVDVNYDNAPVVVPGTGVNGVIILAELVDTFTTTADAQGDFSTEITLGEAGTYTLTATGLESRKVATAVVSVDPSFAEGTGNGGSDNDGDLADTGADSAMLLWGAAGIVAVGAGVASVAVARRKSA